MKKISPAMIMVALSSLTMFAHESGNNPVINIDSKNVSDELSSEIDVKIATAKMSKLVFDSAPSFVDSIVIDGEKIDVRAYLAASSEDTATSTARGSASVNCYVNCHDACHGSRSWR